MCNFISLNQLFSIPSAQFITQEQILQNNSGMARHMSGELIFKYHLITTFAQNNGRFINFYTLPSYYQCKFYLIQHKQSSIRSFSQDNLIFCSSNFKYCLRLFIITKLLLLSIYNPTVLHLQLIHILVIAKWRRNRYYHLRGWRCYQQLSIAFNVAGLYLFLLHLIYQQLLILRFVHNLKILQMQLGSCPTLCKVQFLSELNVCTLKDCTTPLLRCKNCYAKFHFTMDEGKKKVHPYKKFDQSQYYRNFSYLIKIYEIIHKRFKKAFGKINANSEYFAFQLFICSEIVTNSFQSEQAKTQLYVLKELYYKRAAQFSFPLSSQIIPSIALVTQKSFNNIRTLLTQPSEQQQFLSYYFNQISNNNSNVLENFITIQLENFVKYCEEIKEKNENFNISQYVKLRSQAADKDKTYFTRSFETFLEEKYGEHPEEQQIFTASEYTNFVWQNLLIICKNNEIQQYLDSWVANYQQYAEYMEKQQLQTTLLSFRMWRDHIPSSQGNAIQNKYFLDYFILSFIQALVNSQYSVVSFGAKDWRQYIQYLKDFVNFSKKSGEQFVDLTKYTHYYDFRLKSQDFINNIQNSSQIVYNKTLCIEYLDHVFKQGTRVVKKAYKNFLQKRQDEEKQKLDKLKDESAKVNKQLSQQEGEKFYQLIFNDYLTGCIKRKSLPNKQMYKQFKKQVLERYDQEQIKLANDRMLLDQKKSLEKQLTPINQEQKSKEEGKQSKITHKIDVTQEQLVQYEKESESEEQLPDPDCPCCNGKPEDCEKPECQLMGYCVTCSL